MTKKGLTQANTLRSNNTTSTGYGIVYANEIIGSRSVKTKEDLNKLPDWVLGKDNKLEKGTTYYVENEKCFYIYTGDGWQKSFKSIGLPVKSWYAYNNDVTGTAATSQILDISKIIKGDDLYVGTLDGIEEQPHPFATIVVYNDEVNKVPIAYITLFESSDPDNPENNTVVASAKVFGVITKNIFPKTPDFNNINYYEGNCRPLDTGTQITNWRQTGGVYTMDKVWELNNISFIGNPIKTSDIDFTAATLQKFNNSISDTSHNICAQYSVVDVTHNNIVGQMLLIGDSLGHMVTEILTTSAILKNGVINWNEHSDTVVNTYIRRNHVKEGGNSSIAVGLWSTWTYYSGEGQFNDFKKLVAGELNKKVNTSDIVQQTGDSTTSVMSQKAVFKALYNDKAPTDSVEVNQYIAVLKLRPYTNIVASTEVPYKFQIEVNEEGNISLIRFWNGKDFTYYIFSGSMPAAELNYKTFSNLYFTIVLRNLEKLGTQKRSYLVPVKYVTNSDVDDTITISNKSSNTAYYFKKDLSGNLKIDIVESDLEYFSIEWGNRKYIGPNYPTIFINDFSIHGLSFPFTNETQKIRFKISKFTDAEFKEYLSRLIITANTENLPHNVSKFRIRKYLSRNNKKVIQFITYDKNDKNVFNASSSEFEEEGLIPVPNYKFNILFTVNSNLLPLTEQDAFNTIIFSVKDLPYELRADMKKDEEDLRNVGYFPSNVLQQNYYDDSLTEKKGQLLRTDTIIVNQGNIGSLYSQRNYGFKVIGDDSSNIEYKYFTWSTVQKTQGIYDFSGIKQFLKENYDRHNRSALRLFPSCFLESSSIAYNGKKINFPTYVADIMASENAQFVEYNGYWLLDINCEGVYAEYSKLLQAFGEWLDNTIIDAEKNIKAKDVLLYIDFGLLGPWGEGGWYDLQMTTTVENLLRYTKDFATYVPDIQINIGISLDSAEKFWERNKFVIQSKEIKNNAGYIGMFIDNYGAAFPLLFKPNMKVSEYDTMRELIKKYVQRGDFFTGEFAGWQDNHYWGGNDFLNTYNSFVLFKQPYIRMHNMTVTTNKGVYPIKKISPQTYYVLNNVLSCVGFRYVLSVLNTKVGATSVNIEWELTNIGLNKCFFNIYELYYRVHNTDGTVIDTKIDYDLRTLKPWNDIPLLFAIGNGKYFSTEIPITDKTKDVSIIIKDVKGIQSPLYLSNYGRQEDGSYLLWKSN